jgi:hypothetical protein
MAPKSTKKGDLASAIQALGFAASVKEAEHLLACQSKKSLAAAAWSLQDQQEPPLDDADREKLFQCILDKTTRFACALQDLQARPAPRPKPAAKPTIADTSLSSRKEACDKIKALALTPALTPAHFHSLEQEIREVKGIAEANQLRVTLSIFQQLCNHQQATLVAAVGDLTAADGTILDAGSLAWQQYVTKATTRKGKEQIFHNLTTEATALIMGARDARREEEAKRTEHELQRLSDEQRAIRRRVGASRVFRLEAPVDVAGVLHAVGLNVPCTTPVTRLGESYPCQAVHIVDAECGGLRPGDVLIQCNSVDTAEAAAALHSALMVPEVLWEEITGSKI